MNSHVKVNIIEPRSASSIIQPTTYLPPFLSIQIHTQKIAAIHRQRELCSFNSGTIFKKTVVINNRWLNGKCVIHIKIKGGLENKFDQPHIKGNYV